MTGWCDMIIRDEAWPRLDAGAAAAFIEASDPGVIFLRGGARAEAEAIAMVLRELRREMVGLLRVAVGRTKAEPALQHRLGLATVPGVAWVGAGTVLAQLEGVQSLQAYTAATDRALARLSHVLAENGKDVLF
jgi:thioredoxin-like negative regulator of GroEL